MRSVQKTFKPWKSQLSDPLPQKKIENSTKENDWMGLQKSLSTKNPIIKIRGNRKKNFKITGERIGKCDPFKAPDTKKPLNKKWFFERVYLPLISLCRVWRFKLGLYFFFSTRSVCNFLLRVDMYRETGFPSPRASVHSKMMWSLAISIQLLT